MAAASGLLSPQRFVAISCSRTPRLRAATFAARCCCEAKRVASLVRARAGACCLPARARACVCVCVSPWLRVRLCVCALCVVCAVRECVLLVLLVRMQRCVRSESCLCARARALPSADVCVRGGRGGGGGWTWSSRWRTSLRRALSSPFIRDLPDRARSGRMCVCACAYSYYYHYYLSFNNKGGAELALHPRPAGQSTLRQTIFACARV